MARGPYFATGTFTATVSSNNVACDTVEIATRRIITAEGMCNFIPSMARRNKSATLVLTQTAYDGIVCRHDSRRILDV